MQLVLAFGVRDVRCGARKIIRAHDEPSPPPLSANPPPLSANPPPLSANPFPLFFATMHQTKSCPVLLLRRTEFGDRRPGVDLLIANPRATH
eukprot:1978321-Pyramimonas_sp.AAC.1